MAYSNTDETDISEDYSEIRLSRVPKTISLLGLFVFIFLSFISLLFIIIAIIFFVLFIISNDYYQKHRLFFLRGHLCFETNEKFAVRVYDIDSVEYIPVISFGSFFSLVNISVKTIKGNTYTFGPVDDTQELRTYIREQRIIHQASSCGKHRDTCRKSSSGSESQRNWAYREEQTSSTKSHDKTSSELSEAEAKKIFERMRNSAGVMLENRVEDTITHSRNIHGIVVLRNLYVPRKSPGIYSEVDLVVIHDTGVYVFECKNYSGRVYGYVNAQNWCVYYPNGENHHLLNPILQNHSHITALSRYLNLDKSYFKSWIVFSSMSGNKIPDSSSSYVICDCHDLDGLFSYILLQNEVLFTSEEKYQIYQQLKKCTLISYKERVRHAERIRRTYGVDEM